MSANGQVTNPFSPEASATVPATSPAIAPASLTSRAIRALRQGNLLLVALVVAGLGGVYLLSLRSGPATASAQQIENELRVDAALTSWRHSPQNSLAGQKSRTIVDMFYHETRQKQVPASALQTNPFVFKVPSSNSPLPLNNEPTASIRIEPDVTGPAALAAVKKLRLQSVLMGSSANQHVAMVSNNLLGVGQEISGWTVRQIEPSRVTLTWREQQYVLEMPR